jgi:hypothetical protein
LKTFLSGPKCQWVNYLSDDVDSPRTVCTNSLECTVTDGEGNFLDVCRDCYALSCEAGWASLEPYWQHN